MKVRTSTIQQENCSNKKLTTFGSGRSHKLKKLLGGFQIFCCCQLVGRGQLLSIRCIDNRLQNVFLWKAGLKIFQELKSVAQIFLFQIIDGQIESSFRYEIEQGRQHLQSKFSISKNNQIVTNKFFSVREGRRTTVD